MTFSSSQRSHQIFVLLLLQALSFRHYNNSPIWSHCHQCTFREKKPMARHDFLINKSLLKTMICGQSYKHFTIVHYDSRVVYRQICSQHDSSIVIYDRKVLYKIGHGSNVKYANNVTNATTSITANITSYGDQSIDQNAVERNSIVAQKKIPMKRLL